jgi:signal transduction histidine kinase
MRVLLIEDNEDDALIIRETLNEIRGTPFDLEWANRLSIGLERLNEGGVDVILLDLGLPDSQGLETLSKANDQAPEVPIVVLTGLADETLGVKAVQEGAQDYLVKGQVDGNLLVRALRYAIERKRAEEALREYSERLEEMVEERTKELRDAQEQLVRREKLAVLGQLAGGVAHELRSPLGSIKSAAYFLNMVLKDPEPDVVEMLQILERQVADCDRIISSILDFARPKAPTLRPVDLRQLVQETLARQPVLENITVSTQFDGLLPQVMADPDQLGLVFGNIIRNAAQAMPQGGWLEITAGLTEEGVAVAFHDTGVGIPPDHLGKMFEPLFTTKATGIGLGLAVSKQLMKGHGGSIEVRSEVGKGSTFTVRLPSVNET